MPAPLNLPVAQLIEVLGLPDALKLVSHFGGGSVYLPHPSRLREGNAIAAAIGRPAATKLCAEWPQLDVMVPRLAAELRRIRDRAIRRERATLSVTRLAWKYQTTERHVYRVLAGEDDGEPDAAPSAQRDLFAAD